MLTWILIFLVVALVAGVCGFGGIAAGAVGVAKALFFIFLVLFIGALIFGSCHGYGWHPVHVYAT